MANEECGGPPLPAGAAVPDAVIGADAISNLAEKISGISGWVNWLRTANRDKFEVSDTERACQQNFQGCIETQRALETIYDGKPGYIVETNRLAATRQLLQNLTDHLQAAGIDPTNQEAT